MGSTVEAVQPEAVELGKIQNWEEWNKAILPGIV